MKLYAWHKQYGKMLPFKYTRTMSRSKWYRVTATELAPNHKGLVWYPDGKTKVKQIPADFGTVWAEGKPITINRRFKVKAKGVDRGGPYLIIEWIGPGSGAVFRGLIHHTICTVKLNVWLDAMTLFGKVATRSQNKGHTPHTHVSFVKDMKPIHPSKVII